MPGLCALGMEDCSGLSKPLLPPSPTPHYSVVTRVEYFSTYRKTATDGLWQLLLRRRSQNSPPPPTFPAAAPAVGRGGGWHPYSGPRFTLPPLLLVPTWAKDLGSHRSAEEGGARLSIPVASATSPQLGEEGHPDEGRWGRKKHGSHDPQHTPTYAQSQTSPSYTSTVDTTRTNPQMAT